MIDYYDSDFHTSQSKFLYKQVSKYLLMICRNHIIYI